jgi:hypothetical protein
MMNEKIAQEVVTRMKGVTSNDVIDILTIKQRHPSIRFIGVSEEIWQMCLTVKYEMINAEYDLIGKEKLQ